MFCPLSGPSFLKQSRLFFFYFQAQLYRTEMARQFIIALFFLTCDDTLIIRKEHPCTTEKILWILGRCLKTKCSCSGWCPVIVHLFSPKLMLIYAVLFDRFKVLAYHSPIALCPSEIPLGRSEQVEQCHITWLWFRSLQDVRLTNSPDFSHGVP